MPLSVTCIRCGATCLNPILRCLEEPKWPSMPTKTNHTSLQGIPQNTKGELMPIENGINRLNISMMCKYVMLHQKGGLVQYMSSDYIRKNIVVCNGGDTTSHTIKNTSAFKSVHYLWIRDGDLWVADTANASIGLCFILPGESLPVFIHLPRDTSLSIMNNGQSICKAMQSCASIQSQSLSRGTNNHIFHGEW